MVRRKRTWRALTAALALTLVLGGGYLWQKTLQLEQSQLNASVAELNWVSWLTGRSSSYPFHFLDLLELLFRSKSHEQSAL